MRGDRHWSVATQSTPQRTNRFIRIGLPAPEVLGPFVGMVEIV
jgi:hypothetical protein